jgi:DNA-binding MarR family transcriptional regulator
VTAVAAAHGQLTRTDLGFLLAKASQRWNELLRERFVAAGYPDIRPSYGSVLVPLYEEDGLRIGEIARRSRLSKQTMTTMVRLLERDGLVERRDDPADGRASLIFLAPRAREFRPIAERAVAELREAASAALSAAQERELRGALRELAALP